MNDKNNEINEKIDIRTQTAALLLSNAANNFGFPPGTVGGIAPIIITKLENDEDKRGR